MNFKPLYDKVVLQELEGNSISEGGIHMPTDTRDIREAKVLAVGPGAKNPDGSLSDLTVKSGDTVLYRKNSGYTCTVGGEDVRVVCEMEILGIVA
jgi:chaperonin GroES